MNKFQVKIVTAEGLFFQGEGYMVVVPALDGSFGFLPGHQASVIALGSGDVIVSDTDKSDDKSAKRFNVSGGYAQCFGDSVIVLAQEINQ